MQSSHTNTSLMSQPALFTANNGHLVFLGLLIMHGPSRHRDQLRSIIFTATKQNICIPRQLLPVRDIGAKSRTIRANEVQWGQTRAIGDNKSPLVQSGPMGIFASTTPKLGLKLQIESH